MGLKWFQNDLGESSFFMKSRGSRRSVSHLFAVFLLSTTLAGCSGSATSDITGSLSSLNPFSKSSGSSGSRRGSNRGLQYWEQKFKSDPRNRNAAIEYSALLRESGQASKALQVINHARQFHGEDQVITGEYGKALASSGRFDEALQALSAAHNPRALDWRLLSTHGTVLDQLGKHTQAQEFYRTALSVSQNNPAVLSNYGLSLALSGDLNKSERLLRAAVAQPGAEPTVYQNLALVLGLKGNYREAEAISAKHLTPQMAAANSAYLRQLKQRPASWDELRKADQS